ncbi:branched-chain amino acid ABC transporter permease [Mangrovicoccus ximenensis]|uniref:branched-chain amino acid ABC transporter permease n=1 Tax=Mangrovicoccus ximenensis TaxID=1911570 RepID=UPI000D33AA36|nr:branched-chain amino acid ABC transporter permease [Mangrovicoccus ximenensis]
MTRLIPYAGFAALAVLSYLLLAAGKPPAVTGLFLVSGLAVGSLYALGGIGLVVLYRATGVLNLASGAIGAAAVMCAWQLQQWAVPGWLTWIAAILIGVALSLLYGRLLAPRLAWRDPVVKAVATLGFALVILGLTAFAWEDDVRKFSLPTDAMGLKLLGMRVTVTRLIVVGAAVAMVAAIWLYLERTRTGLQMRALADDRGVSAMIGVRILRVEGIAWGLAGAIAGFTGLMFGDLIRLDPVIITFMVIPSAAAAICGRLDNLGLVLAGGLAIGVAESLLTLSPVLKSVRPTAPFVIAALVLMLMQRNARLLFAKD